MTTATTTPPARRTKAARSAATRARLLDATIDCLVELGWSGASTTEVVRRAGVSRGAQVHHYPTKEDLVLAAIEHLLARRLAEYHDAFESLPTADRTAGTALDLLWDTCTGPTFEAWLELAVAARTDPTLRERFIEVEQRFWDANLERFQRMFPEAADPAFARVALRLSFSILDGVAMGRIVGVAEQELLEVREAFKALVAPYFPSTGGSS